MTLASAIALRPDDGAPFLLTFSDSRLTLGGSGATPGSSTDTAIKSVGLGPKSVVLMAGSTTLPVITAAEAARGLIANANANRSGKTPMSLLEEARQFLMVHQLCFRNVPESSSHRADAIIAGFFADGIPGLVHVANQNGTAQLEVYRPRRGDFSVVTIGDPYYAGIATQGIGEVLLTSPSGGALIQQVASVYWDVIGHEGTPGIGGGLCLGMCRHDHSCWQWPMLTIGRANFYRGLPVEKVPDEWRPATIDIRHDGGTFARLERSCPPDGFATRYPTGTVTDDQETVRLAFDPSDWEPTADEALILGQGDQDPNPQ
jgi:hypothetical protein